MPLNDCAQKPKAAGAEETQPQPADIENFYGATSLSP
jgi:hypothetical protein